MHATLISAVQSLPPHGTRRAGVDDDQTSGSRRTRAVIGVRAGLEIMRQLSVNDVASRLSHSERVHGLTALKYLIELNICPFHFGADLDFTELLQDGSLDQLHAFAVSPCALRCPSALRRLAQACPDLVDLDVCNMADLIESAREALRPNGPVTVLHGVRLADIEGIKGTFTNATLDYRSPCTASERGTCHIVRQLSVWNEFLLDAYLELRKETDTMGFLSLVTLERAYPSIPEARKLHQCATLVYWLLTIHRCVVSVDVHLRNLGPHYVLIFAALRRNPAVKTLKLGLWTYRSDHQEPLVIANCLENIEELECRLFPDWPPHILSALTMLLGEDHLLIPEFFEDPEDTSAEPQGLVVA
ncbi:hypothetical protein MRX96_049566 [Rhipicephalus microplus]